MFSPTPATGVGASAKPDSLHRGTPRILHVVAPAPGTSAPMLWLPRQAAPSGIRELSMYIYIYIYIYIYMYVCVYIYIYIFVGCCTQAGQALRPVLGRRCRRLSLPDFVHVLLLLLLLLLIIYYCDI